MLEIAETSFISSAVTSTRASSVVIEMLAAKLRAELRKRVLLGRWRNAAA